MNRMTFDWMYDHVRAIHHAITGRDLPAAEPREPVPIDLQALVVRFAELDAWARLMPRLAVRVPPLMFTPPVDVIEREKELVIDVALPGVERGDVDVTVQGSALVISGTRRLTHEEGANGWGHRAAEIPRGPFRRVIPLPPDVAPEPLRTDELALGILRIHLSKLAAGMRGTA